MTDLYQKENNPGNKFLNLLAKTEQMFLESVSGRLDKIDEYFRKEKYPLEVVVDTKGIGTLKITGELPFINDKDFKALLEVLLEKLDIGALNYLLKTAGSKFRITEVATVRTGKFVNFPEIVEISL